MDFDLEGFLPYRLNRAADLISRRFAEEYRTRYGMTRPEWRTLAALGARGQMTATEIGAHSSMHKTKVSRAVRALEDRRWLKRRVDDTDRRLEHLELTITGSGVYDAMTVVARNYEQELLRLLGSAALRDLDGGLTAIETRLGAHPVRNS